MEKAEHKKFSVQGFWDEHFGEVEDDESSDDSSDGERSDLGRPSHELGTASDDETAGTDHEDSDEDSDDEDSDDERSDSGRPSPEPVTDLDDDTTNKKSSYVEDPPLELNYDALKHIAENFLPGSHGACTDITTLECGYFNEERILHFEDGWSCFGLFARDPKDKILEQVESSLATIEYVRAHTTIAVPQVYFVNHDENHVVGSAFILMERMPGTGETLYDVWDELSREQKIGLVGDVAGILGQLAELRFDSIGCLRHDGTVGPLLSVRGEARKLGDQPVTTMRDYISAYIDENDPNRSEDVREYYPAIKEELFAFLDRMGDNPTLRAPYRLIHGSFESYDFLVERKDDTVRISGIADWDYSRTGPLYQLCEYPQFIRDHDGEGDEEDRKFNKVLRKHFVSSLARCFPRGSADRKHVKQSFREKSYALNTLHDLFMYRTSAPQFELSMVGDYLKGLRGESNGYFTRAYGGIWDWQPDSEPESDGE
jgi:hypothetical protein